MSVTKDDGSKIVYQFTVGGRANEPVRDSWFEAAQDAVTAEYGSFADQFTIRWNSSAARDRAKIRSWVQFPTSADIAKARTKPKASDWFFKINRPPLYNDGDQDVAAFAHEAVVENGHLILRTDTRVIASWAPGQWLWFHRTTEAAERAHAESTETAKRERIKRRVERMKVALSSEMGRAQ